MEVEILKEALDVARVKPELAAAVMERSKGRFAMKALADTLAVARSNLIERVSGAAKPRRPYRKAGDEPLLALIRRLVDERPTYGYRRITRLVNRRQKAEGKPNINAKRVLRIMQANQLTLERHTGRRLGRTHGGVERVLGDVNRAVVGQPFDGLRRNRTVLRKPSRRPSNAIMLDLLVPRPGWINRAACS